MLFGTKGAAEMISAETMTADTHFTLIHLLICIHTVVRPRQPGVKSWHVSFLSTFSPRFPTFPRVRTVKWWIDSSGIGGEEQASISERRRGAFTEMSSIHLASLQPGLSRQLQLSAYWIWQHKYWPSAAIVSLLTIIETQTSVHAHRHSLLTLYLILPLAPIHPASVCETDHWDAQHGREPATGLNCALIVPKPSKCQWCLQGMPAVCVCLYSVRLRGFMSLHVHVCVAERFSFSPTGDTMLWSCLSSSRGCFSLLLLTENSVCVCVCVREWGRERGENRE